ncbi:MAG: 3'(2'),5'-bisphosphate nucleotidase CysQ family protein [Acidiferrobacteraceae bacterium]
MSFARSEATAFLDAAKAAVEEAGGAILACPRPSDGYPASGQTPADRQAHQAITEVLSRLAPQVPIASEEGARHVTARRYWLVDPLDGTKEYVAGNGQYTVNVALIEDGYPVLAAVSVPVTGALFWGSADAGAWRRQGGSAATQLPAEPQGAPPLVLTSRSHSSPAMAHATEVLRAGGAIIEHLGSSWKFARVAEGSADLYVRLSPTYAWDTAAGQCLVESAGGFVGGAGGRLRYAASDDLTPGFIAARSETMWRKWASTLEITRVLKTGG